MKPISTLSRKPRALLVYDADRTIDLSHPLYNEIMLYAEALAEVHVMIFIRHLPVNDQRVVNLSANVFAYYLPGNIFWRIDDLWPMIKYHLIWQKEFRPDFVLNTSTHHGALLGYILAKRYGRRFFIATSGSFLEMPFFSADYLQNSFLMKVAYGIFAPGEKIADMLVRQCHVATTKVSVVHPAIDLSFLERKIDTVNYAKEYPAHNFFLLTRASIGRARELAFVLKVFAEVITKYPRVALVIIVPSAHIKRIKRAIAFARHPGVYVYPDDGDTVKYFGAANLFLSVSEENIIPVVCALGLHVPVVATTTGIAKELFAGSRYERYIQPFGDIHGYAALVMSLIGNAQERDEYRLNSTILLKSLTLQTTQGYVGAMLANIKERMTK